MIHKLKAVAKRFRSHLPVERKAVDRGFENITNELNAIRCTIFKNSPSKIFSFNAKTAGGGNRL